MVCKASKGFHRFLSLFPGTPQGSSYLVCPFKVPSVLLASPHYCLPGAAHALGSQLPMHVPQIKQNKNQQVFLTEEPLI